METSRDHYLASLRDVLGHVPGRFDWPIRPFTCTSAAPLQEDAVTSRAALCYERAVRDLAGRQRYESQLNAVKNAWSLPATS